MVGRNDSIHCYVLVYCPRCMWSSLGHFPFLASHCPSTGSTSRVAPRTVERTTVREVGRDLYLVQSTLNPPRPPHWFTFTTGTTNRCEDHSP
uniref:Uncharacterized protein n=1 Tax=Solanum tuberosum TaxID=4113 RepID=M1DRM9_SOLTU